MASSAAAYAPLAGADEQQPLAAAAVERDDAEAPDEAGAPRDTAADDSESEPEPSEAAEQPKEEEEEEQEPAEDDADGTGGSVAAAAATRGVDCGTDEELMGAIESVEEAATLKRVEIPQFVKITADGVRKFAERARQLQEEGGMTRDFELHVESCEWGDGQLGSLAGVALSKLTLKRTKGVKSADVAAFAERARQLQEQEEGRMTRDFELTVEYCGWTMDHLRAALSESGPSYGSFDLGNENFVADGTRLVAKRIADRNLPVKNSVIVSSSPELSAFLELVAVTLHSPLMGTVAVATKETSEPNLEGAQAEAKDGNPSDKQRIAITMHELKDKYPAVYNVADRSKEGYLALVPTDVPPLQLAVAMAAHCKEWAALYPSDT
eukprot:COSAG06_NODE_4806_length_3937_cov_3.154647_3_plen_381_part_00